MNSSCGRSQRWQTPRPLERLPRRSARQRREHMREDMPGQSQEWFGASSEHRSGDAGRQVPCGCRSRHQRLSSMPRAGALALALALMTSACTGSPAEPDVGRTPEDSSVSPVARDPRCTDVDQLDDLLGAIVPLTRKLESRVTRFADRLDGVQNPGQVDGGGGVPEPPPTGGPDEFEIPPSFYPREWSHAWTTLAESTIQEFEESRESVPRVANPDLTEDLDIAIYSTNRTGSEARFVRCKRCSRAPRRTE